MQCIWYTNTGQVDDYGALHLTKLSVDLQRRLRVD